MNSLATQDLWIGGNDVAMEGAYAWSNGEPWVFASWAEGVPIDQGGYRDCVTLVASAGALPAFDARMCAEERGYLCEATMAH